jgi:hypothetical protein
MTGAIALCVPDLQTRALGRPQIDLDGDMV